jgi:hypothetical protein
MERAKNLNIKALVDYIGGAIAVLIIIGSVLHVTDLVFFCPVRCGYEYCYRGQPYGYIVYGRSIAKFLVLAFHSPKFQQAIDDSYSIEFPRKADCDKTMFPIDGCKDVYKKYYAGNIEELTCKNLAED